MKEAREQERGRKLPNHGGDSVGGSVRGRVAVWLSWFVVERFSAVMVPFRNALKSALKRSTTNLTCESHTATLECDLLSPKGRGQGAAFRGEPRQGREGESANRRTPRRPVASSRSYRCLTRRGTASAISRSMTPSRRGTTERTTPPHITARPRPPRAGNVQRRTSNIEPGRARPPGACILILPPL